MLKNSLLAWAGAPRRRSPLLLAVLAAACGCSESRSESRRDGVPQAAAAPSGREGAKAVSAHPGEPGAAPSVTAGSAAPEASGSAAEPAPYDGPYFGATAFHALILSEMEWPPAEGSHRKSSVVRLGYIRHGQRAPVIPEAHKKENCKEGWYELVAGGFVCGRYGTLDINSARFRGTHGPDLTAALPYSYAMNGSHGTPLYRQVPPREERIKYEPWLAKPKSKPRPASSDDVPDPYASDAGAPLPRASTSLPPLPATPATAQAAPPPDDSTPWYLREYDAGAQPQVTLDELREDGELVAKRMVKGFYLSVEKKFEASDHSLWWKLNDGLVAPADRVWPAKPSGDYHGVWLVPQKGGLSPLPAADVGPPIVSIEQIPIGFISSKTAHKWIMADSRKHATQGGALRRWQAVKLTNETATISGVEYCQTDEGWWIRGIDGTKTEPGPPPDGSPARREVDRREPEAQTLVAFEGDDARLRDAHLLERRPERARDASPGSLPHPREAHRRDDGRRRRHRGRRPVLDPGRPLHRVLQRRATRSTARSGTPSSGT